MIPRSPRRRVLPALLRAVVPVALGSLACTLAACAPEEIGVVPSSEDELVVGSKDVAALRRVPESGPGGVDVRVSSSGAHRHPRRKSEGSVVITVTVSLENRGPGPVGLDPTAVRLLDHDRHALAPISAEVATVTSDGTLSASDANVGRPEAASATTLAPGERRSFDLVFRSDETRDPREPFPCVLRLAIRGDDDRERSIEVKLLEDAYGSRSRAWGYGPGWGYGSYHGGWGPGWGPGLGWGWGPGWPGWYGGPGFWGW